MIVVFGSVNLDLIFHLPALPAPGQTLAGDSVRMEPGGKGANQALAAARDGAAVIMAGAVGDDPLAGVALALLAEAEIDLSRVSRRRGIRTGCAAIFVDPAGRNAIGVGSGANRLADAADIEDAILGAETTVLMQMEVPVQQNAALIARGRRRGCRLVLNLAPASPLTPGTLRALDVVVVNEDESAWLARQLGCAPTAAALHRVLERPAIVRTLGERGAEAAARGEAITVEGIGVAAVDTTAAGDCFTGVLAAMLDRGASLSQALRRANVAAALCCTRQGSQATMPHAAETDAALSRLG